MMAPAQPQDTKKAFPAIGHIQEADTCVKSNTAVNAEYHLLTLEAPQSILHCQPGQFFHLLCPVTAAWQPYLRRPMSIYGYSREKGELRFLYKVTGEGTGALAELDIGDTLNVLGPLGVGFSIQSDWQNLLLLARGVGLATLAPLAQEANRLNRNLIAICSARSAELLMSIDHFCETGAEVITLTDATGTSAMDNLRRIITLKISEGVVDAMYTCGSNRMLKLAQEIGATYSIPGQIALEQRMACGLGMCQCCVRSFNRGGLITQKRVCLEGPVFDIQETMAW